MPLNKQNVTFPFVRGINKKVSEESQPVGELRKAENCVITKTGELNSRYGFHEETWSEFGGASQPSELFGAAKHQDESVVFDGERAYSRYTTGKFKDRGTCVNVEMKQKPVSVDGASMDGAPAYSTIKVGSDNDLYEIFVWESRPFGEEDVNADTKSYFNSADTINYRNKQTQLLYSVRHKASGVLLYDAVPIDIPFASGVTKNFVDRDLLISSAGVTGYGVSRGTADPAENNQLRIFGYGSSPQISGREWADVVEDGNQLVFDGPFDNVTGGNAKASMFFTDASAAATASTYVRVAKLSTSAIDNSGLVVARSDTAMANVDAYINVETGKNALYFTTQPMLFSMTDNVVVLTFAAQSAEGYSGNLGVWSIFQATFDFTSAASAIGTVSLLSSHSGGYLDLNYKYPIWDADIVYTTEDDHGVCYIYNTTDSTNHTKLQYYKYDSGTKKLVTTPTASINVPRADGSTAGQQIQMNPFGTGKAQFGGTAPSGWVRSACPSRFVLKGINHTDSGNLENHANNKIVFVFRSADAEDNDIFVYTAPALTDSAFGSFSAGLIKPLLDRATSSSTWVIPDDLAVVRNTSGDKVKNLVTYNSGSDKYACNELMVVNAAITNVKSVTADSVFLFVEVAEYDGDTNILPYNRAASSGTRNTFIAGENRWIIRKNLANSDDTKVLGRNIHVLSDAFYPYSGSKAYWAGHTVAPGDPSTARTCLFNEDGEVVGVYASGQAALCHPYEIHQMAAPVTKYANTPLFALRSRLNYHRTDSVLQPYKLSNSPGLADYPMPEFGISVIENAEKSYQFMAPFNSRVATCDFFPSRSFPSANINGTLFVGSGLLWSFNGGKFVENGFLQKPKVTQVTVANSEFSNGTASTAGANKGEYTFAAAYYWKDDMGVGHYSALDFFGDGSEAEVVGVTSAGKRFIVAIENTSITNKRGPAIERAGYSGTAPTQETVADMDPSAVSIAIFYSANLAEQIQGENTPDTVNIPLRLVAMQPLSTNARTALVSIDFANKNVQFKEKTVLPSPLLESAPVQPSCPTDITIHKNHVCVSTTDGYVYPSQSFSSTIGTEGSAVCPVFSALNTINIGEETGGVGVSNVESDGQFLFGFNKDAVYAFGGDGPDEVNFGNFTPPETIYLDQGLAVGGATARIPAGVVYQSTHGLYLLNGKNLSYIGAPLDGDWGTAASVGNISATAVLDETNEIVFVTGQSSSQSVDPYSYLPSNAMDIFVYNYEVGQWTTWRIPRDQTGQAFSGATYVKRSDGKRDLFLTDNKGGVWLYTSDSSSSSSSYQYADYSQSKSGGAGYYRVQLVAKTGLIQFPQFMSGARMYRLIVPFSPNNITEFKVDYTGRRGVTTSSETFSFTQTNADVDLPQDITIKPAMQKIDQLQVEIVCRTQNDTHQPPALNGLGMLIAPRGPKSVYNQGSAQQGTTS